MTRIGTSRPANLPANLVMAAILLAALSVGHAFGSPDGGDPSPVAGKVLATMRSAVEGSPEMVLRTSRLGAEAAEIRSTTGAGAPTLAWQREGIGSGFDRRPNSADYFRVSLPFNLPWQRGANRSLEESTGRLLETGTLSSRLEVATLAARLWLDLAAEAELAELAEARVGRLEKAVATQTRRYELGEISGFERTQLELELALERAALRQSETRRRAAEQRVVAVAQGGFPLPEGGDLMRLVEATTAALPGDVALETGVAESLRLRLAEIRSEITGTEARTQRHSAWGRPELELEWERIPDLGLEGGYDAAGIHVVFPLPFGRQGHQKILATEQRAAAAGAERDRLRRELSSRSSAALASARGAEAALESLKATAERVPATEHSLAEQFRLGAISYVVYLDGLSRLDEVRQGMIETRYTLLTARLELARLFGTDTYFPLPGLDGEG